MTYFLSSVLPQLIQHFPVERKHSLFHKWVKVVLVSSASSRCVHFDVELQSLRFCIRALLRFLSRNLGSTFSFLSSKFGSHRQSLFIGLFITNDFLFTKYFTAVVPTLPSFKNINCSTMPGTIRLAPSLWCRLPCDVAFLVMSPSLWCHLPCDVTFLNFSFSWFFCFSYVKYLERYRFPKVVKDCIKMFICFFV